MEARTTREMTGPMCQYPSESALVVEAPSQSFRFLEIPTDLPEFSQRKEGPPKIEADIDGLLPRLARFGEMVQRREGLLEVRECLPARRSRQGFAPRLPKVRHGLLPQVAPNRV